MAADTSTTAIVGRTDSRRLPQQQRSRAKVDAILVAADALVGASGVNALTTTLVAERADVAVGSLYQYFDGVPAIVEALVARHAELFGEHLRGHLAGATFRRKRDAANAALDALIDYYRTNAAFRSLWNTAPRITGAGFGDAGDMLVGIITQAIRAQGMDTADATYEREAKVQWAIATALIQLAFEMDDEEGDAAVLAHLRRLFALDVPPVD